MSRDFLKHLDFIKDIPPEFPSCLRAGKEGAYTYNRNIGVFILRHELESSELLVKMIASES
ncbi:hypothetical protein BMS3Bbin04_00904 [bacterium BMS3Bbin04]|nr:hypothetical protein BMS3Bbin04_00904 [bacterium BMS3Bbin04]